MYVVCTSSYKYWRCSGDQSIIIELGVVWAGDSAIFIFVSVPYYYVVVGTSEHE